MNIKLGQFESWASNKILISALCNLILIFFLVSNLTKEDKLLYKTLCLLILEILELKLTQCKLSSQILNRLPESLNKSFLALLILLINSDLVIIFELIYSFQKKTI